MPIPTPSQKDDRESFLDRCMSDSVMNTEYKDTEQRYAVCISKWEDKKAKASTVISTCENEHIIIE